ncbi:DUF2786 domain-containing protein [Thauera sp. 2A1]|uniref:DUF7168 domain-containing protein n=1 Tax=Thauera sp. 2A1 TaxID=2570191 RepID=UPI0012911C44|nr:DUF2786 domain-containing protein [Thauera sp. 2A1]KAI5914579.1 DUF2786 domain-containing protein [Thauera sp. 2A1]
MNSNDRILDKIRKCMALSASSNEAEAAAALRQARALMDKHGISADDVLASEAGFAEVRAGALSRPANWEAALAGRVGLVFGCRVIFSRTARGRLSSWVFIGTGANYDVATYCFDVLFRQVKKARAEHIKTALRRCKATTKTRRADLFCEGWVATAVGKLDAMVLGERDQQALDAFIAQRFPSLRDLHAMDRNAGKKTLSDRDYNDYAAGRVSGRTAELNRGVGADGAPLALE